MNGEARLSADPAPALTIERIAGDIEEYMYQKAGERGPNEPFVRAYVQRDIAGNTFRAYPVMQEIPELDTRERVGAVPAGDLSITSGILPEDQLAQILAILAVTQFQISAIGQEDQARKAPAFIVDQLGSDAEGYEFRKPDQEGPHDPSVQAYVYRQTRSLTFRVYPTQHSFLEIDARKSIGPPVEELKLDTSTLPEDQITQVLKALAATQFQIAEIDKDSQLR
jgi:hypothetical protein